jgi:hypothetical protein
MKGDLQEPRMSPQESDWLSQPTKESSATLEVAGWTRQKKEIPEYPTLRGARKRKKRESEVEDIANRLSAQNRTADRDGAGLVRCSNKPKMITKLSASSPS